MRIGRTYRFEAGHRLPLVPEGHKCRNWHGHNYRVEVVVEGSPERGMVMDFFDLDALMGPLLAEVDHHQLNDIPTLSNPTAEVIAEWFLRQLPLKVRSVKVWETDDCWAEASR